MASGSEAAPAADQQLVSESPPPAVVAPGDAGRVEQGRLVVIAVLSAAIWLSLGGSALLRPVELLVTLVHEASHALAAMLAGANVGSVTVNSRGGGLTHMSGDLTSTRQVIVASAGYVGTALVGAAMLEMCAWLRGGRAALASVAGLVAAIGLAWVPWRTNPTGVSALVSGSSSGDGRFTVLVCVVAVAVFAGLAVQPSAAVRRFAIVFLSTGLCLGAIDDLQLVRRSAARGGFSDAAIAASVSPLSSWMWATIWLLLGVGLCFVGAWSLVARDDRGALSRRGG